MPILSEKNPQIPYSRLERYKLSRDYRASLPSWLTRFIGYRKPGLEPPYKPLPFPPFCWLKHIPIKYEVWIFAWIGCFGGILLIEAIMSADTAFRDVYHAPLIVTSFGASAVLLFAAIESPLAQPRNFVLGHFVSALVGVAITRLWGLNPHYHGYLDNTAFHGNTFINGALCMATSALGQLIIGAVHPPAGATGLNAAVQSDIMTLSWRYLPTILASCLIMLGWALIINNLGRRRYPIYWWKPGQVFVSTVKREKTRELRRELSEVEAGLRVAEGGVFQAEGETETETQTPAETDQQQNGSNGSEERK